MPRVSNYWLNPVTGELYAWPVNHTTETVVGKSRQMGDGAPTNNIGLNPQQGAATPLILDWTGTIFTKAFLDVMIRFYELCETQSVYVQDFQGAAYEVIISDFGATRVGVAQNRWDPTNAPTWKWTYDLKMRVLVALTGDWALVTP